MNIGHVTGGTNAGWKKQKPKASEWTCPSCGKRLRGFWASCPNDQARRPEE
jgi:hypothetical protein